MLASVLLFQWPAPLRALGSFNHGRLTCIVAGSGKAHVIVAERTLSCCLQVTKKTPDQIDAPSRDGAFVSGLVLEGASWWVLCGHIFCSGGRCSCTILMLQYWDVTASLLNVSLCCLPLPMQG